MRPISRGTARNWKGVCLLDNLASAEPPRTTSTCPSLPADSMAEMQPSALGSLMGNTALHSGNPPARRASPGARLGGAFAFKGIENGDARMLCRLFPETVPRSIHALFTDRCRITTLDSGWQPPARAARRPASTLSEAPGTTPDRHPSPAHPPPPPVCSSVLPVPGCP